MRVKSSAPTSAYLKETKPMMIVLGPAEAAALALLASRVQDRDDVSEQTLLEAERLRHLASSIYNSRRFRSRVFSQQFMSDVAWDIMLAAYCLPTQERPLTISGLCYASEHPPTTALRWVNRLIKDGMLQRYPSRTDRRVLFVRLTPQAKSQIELYLTEIYQRFIGTVS